MDDFMAPCRDREPSFADLMREPIIQAVMARDSVAEADIRRLLDRVRAGLEDRAPAVHPN